MSKLLIRSHAETERQQRCARSKAWNLAKNIYKLKEKYKGMGIAGCVNNRAEEREFVVDSGARMHMVSKKDLDELC